MSSYANQKSKRSAYPACKDSGIEWLSEIPEHWEVLKTKFVANTIMGQSPSSDTYIFDGSACPFLQGNAEFGLIHPTPKYFCDTAVKKVPKGALLISVRAPVGAVNIADQPYGIGRGLCAIVEDKKLLLSEFAWHVLTLTRNELWSIATGSTYEAVSVNEVADMLLPIPPLPEQRAIAAFLDQETARIDRLIEKKQRQIELLQEKRAALISHAVTKGLNPNAKMKDSGIEWLGEIPEHWKLMRIGMISLSIQTGPFGSQLHSSDYVDGGIPVINPANIQDGNIIADQRCTIDEPTFKRLFRHRLSTGDIVFGRRGEMGRCAMVANESDGFLCGTGSLRIKLDERQVDPEFITMFLSTQGVRDHLTLESVGSTMDNLNTNILARLPVVIPPLDEQPSIRQYILANLHNTRRVMNTIQTSTDLLREYRTALISAAVTGKIDVRKETA